MSPEQVRAEPLGQRTNVNFLGMLMFEMLTGEPRIEPGAFGSVAARVINSPVVSLGALNPDLPCEADLIFIRAAAKERWGRYDWISKLESALRSLLIKIIKEGY
jgi:hypothetical protein